MRHLLRWLTIPTVFAALTAAQCSSSPQPTSARLRGEYHSTSAGELSTLTFIDATHYWLIPSGSCPTGKRCVESGTYAENAGENSIVFTESPSGKATSLPFKVTSTSPTQSTPLHLVGGVTLGGGGGEGGASSSGEGGTSSGGEGGVVLSSGGPVTLGISGFSLGGQTMAPTGCGTCPTGFTCGTANGTSVCFSSTGVPKFSNIVIIMMENTTLATLQGAGNTPYLTSLGSTWASSSDYHGVTHPSLRNYISLTSGSPQGIGSDNLLNKTFCDCHPTGSSCNAFNCVIAGIPLGNCGCPVNASNVADQLETAGLTWRDYGEGMGTPCNLTDNSSASYAARHNPFLYYTDIQTSSRCTSNVVDYSSFASDLSAPKNFSFIAPNLIHDMHNPFPASSQNYANGDQWLSSQIPTILGEGPWEPGGTGLLVIVWDEDDLSGGLTQSTDNPIPMFLISPLAKSGGYVSSTMYNHYSLLATIEDSFGMPRLANAASAQPMTDFFVNSGPPVASDAGM